MLALVAAGPTEQADRARARDQREDGEGAPDAASSARSASPTARRRRSGPSETGSPAGVVGPKSDCSPPGPRGTIGTCRARARRHFPPSRSPGCRRSRSAPPSRPRRRRRRPRGDVRVAHPASARGRARLRVRTRDDDLLRIELELSDAAAGSLWSVVIVHERRLVFSGRLDARARAPLVPSPHDPQDWFGRTASSHARPAPAAEPAVSRALSTAATATPARAPCGSRPAGASRPRARPCAGGSRPASPRRTRRRG